MDLKTIFIILIVHYIADFIMQTEIMASKKSENIYWLGTHCFIYGVGIFFLLFLCNILSFIVISSYFYLFLFALGNAIFHFLIDFTTSKIETYFYLKKMNRAFFNVIGIDQLAHVIILLISFNFFK